MAQLKIKMAGQSFSLPAPYNDNIWEICTWDIYLNANPTYQSAWKTCSNMMDSNMDFTLCNTPLIREEAKYFSYHLLEEKKVTLRTFAEYADMMKLLFEFVSKGKYVSVLDISIDDFRIFISSSYELAANSRSMLICNNIISSKKVNRILSSFDLMKKAISTYLESDKPLHERDVWLAKDLPNTSASGTYNLDFTDIAQPKMKQAVKDYIKTKLNSVVASTASNNLHDIKIFCHWLDIYDKNIKSFKNVTRDILEEYFLFLRLESGLSQYGINTNILNLSQMFEYGIVFSNPEFPEKVLFLKDDWHYKTKRAAKFYTNEEVKALFSLLPCLPKIYGRILLVLHHTGMRISEVLYLSINALKYTKDGKPYLSVYMYKTERHNRIPIDEYIHRLLRTEIAYVKEKHPDTKYIFVNSDGSAIRYQHFINKIKEEIVNNDIHGRDGKLLEFKTHRFRATKATNLINMGLEPPVVADMLGHKNLASLTYYVVAKEQSLSEHMQEYLRKESILINSIGKVDKAVIEDYENAHPLCNGFCCRPTDLGVCEKLNACLTCSLFKPTLQHLTSYRLQLVEVESSLAMAKENGFKRMAEQCEKEKTALENIIKRLEGET